MLVWLADYLQGFISGFGVFRYLTLRGILGIMTALGISMIMGPWVIKKLNHLQIGQAIRDDGPESHLSKSGTPTMGGTLILFAIVTSTLLWSDLSNRYVLIVVFVTIAYGLIGWVDDYRKVVEKNSKGLPARWKYFWQSIVGLVVAVALFVTAQSPAETTLYIPFFKNFAWEMGAAFHCSYLFYDCWI